MGKGPGAAAGAATEVAGLAHTATAVFSAGKAVFQPFGGAVPTGIAGRLDGR